MTMKTDKALAQYYKDAGSWADDRNHALRSSRRVAWIVAGVAVTVAALEAMALVALAPLKTVVPYTLLVDRQTGNVETLKPLERQNVSPDDALVRSFLAQYVIAREGFDITTLESDYRKVALWSGAEARDRYLASMQPSNPQSPVVTLPRQALIEVEVRSLSSLNADTALVRFVTYRTDPGGQRQPPQAWAAVVQYRFAPAKMAERDRLLNPLGFQVLRYRRNAETVGPEPAPATASPAQAMPGAPMISAPGARAPMRPSDGGLATRPTTPGGAPGPVQ